MSCLAVGIVGGVKMRQFHFSCHQHGNEIVSEFVELVVLAKNILNLKDAIKTVDSVAESTYNVSGEQRSDDASADHILEVVFVVLPQKPTVNDAYQSGHQQCEQFGGETSALV